MSSIGKSEFETLCRLFNGIATEDMLDGKEALLGALHVALTKQQEFREDIDKRKLFLQKLNREKQHLSKLAAAIDKLDEGACIALLTRIEEVYAGDGDELYDRCVGVYDKMQGRRQL